MDIDSSENSAYRKYLKYYFYIGLVGVIVGVYGILTTHVHVAGHPPDILHCIASFGRTVFIPSIFIVLAYTGGLFTKNHTLLKVMFILTTYCVGFIIFSVFSAISGCNLGGYHPVVNYHL